MILRKKIYFIQKIQAEPSCLARGPEVLNLRHTTLRK
jgi:hypothetical protein